MVAIMHRMNAIICKMYAAPYFVLASTLLLIFTEKRMRVTSERKALNPAAETTDCLSSWNKHFASAHAVVRHVTIDSTLIIHMIILLYCGLSSRALLQITF